MDIFCSGRLNEQETIKANQKENENLQKLQEKKKPQYVINNKATEGKTSSTKTT